MAEYIEKEKLFDCLDIKNALGGHYGISLTAINAIPAADVVEEENILKFYYVRSIDEYWIGQRIDNFYYAEYDPKSRQWVWTHSRYLPWGEHIVSPASLWKEHTYPSEPEEIPFAEWLQGFIKKHAADAIEKLVDDRKALKRLVEKRKIVGKVPFDPKNAESRNAMIELHRIDSLIVDGVVFTFNNDKTSRMPLPEPPKEET